MRFMGCRFQNTMIYGPHPLLAPWIKPSWLPKIAFCEAPKGLARSCRLWLGARNADGYGIVRGPGGRSGKLLYIHRLALEKALGAPLGDQESDHLCFRRNCFEESHLEKVTSEENKARSSWAQHQFKAKDKLTPEDWTSLADSSWIYVRPLGYV